MDETPTKEERIRSALGWDTPFLKKGGLLWLLNDMLLELGVDIGDGPAANKFRDALESTVIGLERKLAAVTAERDAALKDSERLKEYEDSIKYLLDSFPGSVRERYKYGEENLLGSLCITFIKLRDGDYATKEPNDAR